MSCMIKYLKKHLQNSKDNNVIFSLPSELILVPLEFLVTSKQKDDSPYYYTNKNS